MRILFSITVLLSVFAFSGCAGGDGSANENANTLPPEFNAKPITPGANSTPGIAPPSEIDVNANPGATPTPGIPAPGEAGKPLPKGATPTPGIPDPETLRKQLEQRNTDPSKVNERPRTASPSPKKNPLDRPRKSGGND